MLRMFYGLQNIFRKESSLETSRYGSSIPRLREEY